MNVKLRFRENTNTSKTVGEAYYIDVIESPYGSTPGGMFFEGDIDGISLGEIRTGFEKNIAFSNTENKNYSVNVDQTVRSIGGNLFLRFSPYLQSLLQKTAKLSLERKDTLNIVLVFNKDAYILMSLPWELLFETTGQFFFALQGSIVRQFYSTYANSDDFDINNGKVLAVWSNDIDKKTLVNREHFFPMPHKTHDWCWVDGIGTWNQFHSLCHQNSWDGLHVVAHNFMRESGKFGLLFLDSDGSEKWVELHHFLECVRTAQIKYLCMETCESGYTKNSDLTMYLLLPILNSGINQLILMQGEIRQDVSGAFMQEFYHAWQKGISFEPAIQSARQKIYHDYSKVQWSIPVVYFVSSRKHLKDNESKLESISNLIRKENILLIIYSVLALLWAGGLSIASGPSYREIFFPPSLAILITNSWKIGLLLILPSLSSWMMTNKQKAIELIIKNAGFKKWEVTSIKFAHALLLNTIIWYLIWATMLLADVLGITQLVSNFYQLIIFTMLIISLGFAGYIGAFIGLRNLELGNGSNPQGQFGLLLITMSVILFFIPQIFYLYAYAIFMYLNFPLAMGIILILLIFLTITIRKQNTDDDFE